MTDAPRSDAPPVEVAPGALVVLILAIRREYVAQLLATLRRRRLDFTDASLTISDEATVLSDSPVQPSYYFRHRFTLEGMPVDGSAHVVHDVVFYL